MEQSNIFFCLFLGVFIFLSVCELFYWWFYALKTVGLIWSHLPKEKCAQALRNVLFVSQEERRVSDTVLFTSQNNDNRMTNQLAFLVRRDYLYLDEFWRVNLSMYIIMNSTRLRSESFVLRRLSSGHSFKKMSTCIEWQTATASLRRHGAGNLLLKDSQIFSTGLINCVRWKGFIFYEVRINF